MEHRSRNPLRLLAPIALAAFALAFLIVVISAGGDADTTPTDAREAEQRDLGATTDEQETDTSEGDTDSSQGDTTDAGLPDDVYVVKSGDTLGAISEKVGISVEQLQELNPALDPQALVSGQQIKLRE